MASTTLANDLDAHLSTYLSLLHSYTTLRAQLSTATSSLNQNLARANFSSDRRRRYGQDDYDERMQASTLIQTTTSESSVPRFEIVKKEDEERRSKKTEPKEKVDEKKENENENGDGDEDAENEEKQDTKEELDEKTEENHPKPKNPALRQFGILVPPALRQAQSTAEEIVTDLIPKLASVDAEMKAVEIEVRRCRKKAKKLEEKEAQEKIKKMDAVGEPATV